MQGQYQQAKQQGAGGQSDAQRLEGVQFGVGVDLGGVLLAHGRYVGGGLVPMKAPGAADERTQVGRSSDSI